MGQPACQAICPVRKLIPCIPGLSTGDSRAVPGYFYRVCKPLRDVHLHLPFMGNIFTLSVAYLLISDCSSPSTCKGASCRNSLPGWRDQHICKRTYSSYVFAVWQEDHGGEAT